MGKLRHPDPVDTIDSAIRELIGLQADGWTLETATRTYETGRCTDKHRELVIGVTVTLKLRPVT